MKPRCDHLGRPLSKHELFSKNDTYWAALCYRVYESESVEKIAQLRQKLLLHFAALIFGQSFEDFDEFNRRMRTIYPHPKAMACHRHPAIQMWVYQLNKADSKIELDIREMDPDVVKDEAISFIRLNSIAGNCTCRFTIGYLFASVFSYDVYLCNDERQRIDVLQAPQQDAVIDVTLIDCDVTIQQGKEEFYVYIVCTATASELWLPHISMSAPAEWLLKGASTRHVKRSAFKLARLEGDRVEAIGFFEQKGVYLHYCIVEPNADAKGIYRVLPGAAGKLGIEAPLFIYTSRGLERDDDCKLVAHVDSEGTPAAFLLNPAETRLIIIATHQNQNFAERCIAEELKLKCFTFCPCVDTGTQ